MASGFTARGGSYRESHQRSGRGSGGYRIAGGTGAMAAGRFPASRRGPEASARRVYQVVCQGLRGNCLGNRAGEPGVSAFSLERLLGEARRGKSMRVREITLQEI